MVLVLTWYYTSKWRKIKFVYPLAIYDHIDFCLLLNCHLFPGIFAVLLGKQTNSTGDSIFAAPPSCTICIPHRRVGN